MRNAFARPARRLSHLMWVVAVICGLGAGFLYWLGLRDGRAGKSGPAAGSRATGILLFFGIALAVVAPIAALFSIALAGVYLMAWGIHRHRSTAVPL